ncbi:MAG: R3H domain-containing nucleic acid-binding protein [Candidatus Melainabacteria bacterium]|nr:R3H domain-containing nucleic acid-binding protein [Candidatus Melainabacteria bacterium]
MTTSFVRAVDSLRGHQPRLTLADTVESLLWKGAIHPLAEAALSADNDLKLLVDVMPERIRQQLYSLPLADLMEVVLDLGRVPEVRLAGGVMLVLDDASVTEADIEHVVRGVGQFTADNRAGITRTLHRISAIRNRQGVIIGLTCRVGRVVTGTIEPIRDLIESGKSILLLGPPGVGKTTKLREVSKMLADEFQKRVIIVDTSNEIAGDGDIPHPAVGRARRMQVQSPELQQQVMIEAVENHTPQVVVVDEIGTEAEALAARTIAERGVVLIATAHGTTLDNLIKNPVLSDLIGGIQSVTLGDDEAKRRSTQKTVLEREKKPTFDVAIEIRDRHTLAIYPDVAEAVDHLLRGWSLFPEVRKVDTETGSTKVLQGHVHRMEASLTPEGISATSAAGDRLMVSGSGLGLSRAEETDEFRVFLYAITVSFVERILDRLNLKRYISVTNNIHDAHAVLALRGHARPGSKVLRLASDYEVPIFYAKTNTMPQIQRALRDAVSAVVKVEGPLSVLSWQETPVDGQMTLLATSGDESLAEDAQGLHTADETALALREVHEAIDRVLAERRSVELAPRRSYIRRIQHEVVEKHNLVSISLGDEPNRRLKILAPK